MRDSGREGWIRGGTAKVRNKENTRCPVGFWDVQVDLSRKGREVGVEHLMNR